eukprot:1140348-Pelagomonas_calceolata.AAC.2
MGRGGGDEGCETREQSLWPPGQHAKHRLVRSAGTAYMCILYGKGSRLQSIEGSIEGQQGHASYSSACPTDSVEMKKCVPFGHQNRD